MSERPILFSGPMVRAILEGRKTQTRRPITHRHGVRMPCPYGETGALLWVRETWGMSYVDLAHDRPHVVGGHWGSPARPGRECAVVFRADGPMPVDVDETARWSPSIHMPRWASRITLRVTDVRVQRLQEISEEDAQAEGYKANDAFILYQARPDGTLQTSEMQRTARGSFAMLWESNSATRASWASNPWVRAISFERVP